MRSSLVLLGIFSAVEIGWIAQSYATLPSEIARDVVWPAYHLNLYASTTQSGSVPRWPEWGGWKIFFGHYLGGVSSLVMSLAMLLKLRNSPSKVKAGKTAGLFFFLFFYALGATGYFGHLHIFRQYLWVLILPAAIFVEANSGLLKIAAVFSWLPGTALLLKVLCYI